MCSCTLATDNFICYTLVAGFIDLEWLFLTADTVTTDQDPDPITWKLGQVKYYKKSARNSLILSFCKEVYRTTEIFYNEKSELYKCRKIRHTEDNAKCRHLNKLACRGTLQVFICLRPRPPYPPPYTLYTCIQVYLFTKGRGIEGESWTREKVREQKFAKLGQKYQHDWLYLQSINSDEHLLQSPLQVNWLRWRHFALVSIYVVN